MHERAPPECRGEGEGGGEKGHPSFPELPRASLSSPSFPELPRASPSFLEIRRDSPRLGEIPRDWARLGLETDELELAVVDRERRHAGREVGLVEEGLLMTRGGGGILS